MNAPVRIAALTYSAMNELLPALEPRQKMVYHVGSLMHDRVRGQHFATVHGVALAAWEAYERGEVILTQRKLTDPYTYEYIAIKRTRNAAGVGGKDGRNEPPRRPAHSPASV